MNKRERIEKAISGDVIDRPPVSLWRHWPGDDQRSADFAFATTQFQKTFDWDFINVTPASSYSVVDYGIKDKWSPTILGDRTVGNAIITKSLHWTELRPLNPERGELSKHIEALRLIQQNMDEEVPIITTIYSPMSQAVMLSGFDVFIRNMRTHQDRLRTGLNIITESILRFIDALKQTNIAGICYVINQASYNIMSESEYTQIALPYDQKILNTLPSKWWFNMTNLQSPAPMFNLISTYPVQAIHWDAISSRPNLSKARGQFKGVICGGLSTEQHLHLATPLTIKSAVREANNAIGNRQFILTSGSPIPTTTPISNIRAVRDAVENIGTF